MAKTIAEIQTQSGSTIRMIESSSGQIQYQSFDNARQGEGQFISKDQGRALFEAANQSEQKNVSYSLQRTSNQDRERALSERYPEWENTKGYSRSQARKHSTDDEEIERLTKIWVDNETIRKMVKNDPLVDSRNRRRAQEAYAREMSKEIMEAENEKEVKQILRSYGFSS